MSSTTSPDAYVSLPQAKYIPMVVLQMLMSLLSIVASVVVLRIAGPKLGSTYQRYLFALSGAVTINSVFLFLHPFLVPRQDEALGAYWAVGTDGTCSAVGFFLVFGALLVSLYSNALALYFYFSIQTPGNNGKRPRDPEEVLGLPEIVTHVFCWLAPAAVAGTAAAFDSYHYDPTVEMCVLFSECDDPSAPDCVPMSFDSLGRYGDSSTVILRNTVQWMLVSSAALSVLITVRIHCQVRKALKGIQQQLQEQREPNLDVDEEQQVGQKLAAVSAQCFLYTLSFLNSYVWFIAIMFIPAANNGNTYYAFHLIAATFYPIIGVFNAIIYIRPRVHMLQMMYSQDPFVVVLRVAMSKAGDPEEIEHIRAEIYGSEYSGSEPRHSVDDDDAFSRDSAIPSVVQFDPYRPTSIKSLVSAPGEDEDKNSTVSALDIGVAAGVGGDAETSREIESQ